MNRRSFLQSTAIGCAGYVIPAGAAQPRTEIEARYWAPMGDDAGCELCPARCIVAQGATSRCRTRINRNGKLMMVGYANPCAVNVDPIEKKPLYHVLPGARAFSIAVAGCVLRCKNCQNHTISQVSPLETRNEYLPPAEVVRRAKESGCSTVAYTYSEPTAWFEYMYDTAKLARQAGLKNLWITSGYINELPLRELAEFMDAANIDLKSFDDAIYRNLNAGRLEPVKECIAVARSLGMWVEITNLMVPEWTDNMAMVRKMCAWIKGGLGEGVPLHFSRFFPLYQLENLYPTPDKTLVEARKIAIEEGLKYVYVGNVAGMDSNTYCHRCANLLIRRRGYIIEENNMRNGACPKCGEKIPGIWEV